MKRICIYTLLILFGFFYSPTVMPLHNKRDTSRIYGDVSLLMSGDYIDFRHLVYQ